MNQQVPSSPFQWAIQNNYIFGSKHPLLMTAVSLLITCGGPLLLARIARDLGKALEERLNGEWGGKPTTVLLRHRDSTIDSLTKKQYHLAIGQGISRAAPSPALEDKSPEQADTFYRAGSAWLISKTQDTKKHALVFKENKHYGFQRNMRGLKWIGIVISCATMAISAVHFYLQTDMSGSVRQILSSVSIQQAMPITISAIMLVCWIFLVTERSVRRAGFAYADRLIRTCAVITTKQKKAGKTTGAK
ncbi:hypothetical protein GJ699_14365 [Duganella sp. FT80W]|uniref:Uncharacterized protein n=1 Tax=Duganella guangzhouensis TaxID=2666084 RepID=A0A6I2L3J5_9BURK|nr:hypothetical protein [Duganella guangzhouensis]MRW91176.1 hypothetical protein [Duganella guangzhouensis]